MTKGKSLSGSAGTGQKIIKNWGDFKFKLKEAEVDKAQKKFFSFDVSFNNQSGYFNITVENGIIFGGSTMDMDFPRPLSANNDTTNYNDGLYEVAKKIILASGHTL